MSYKTINNTFCN